MWNPDEKEKGSLTLSPPQPQQRLPDERLFYRYLEDSVYVREAHGLGKVYGGPGLPGKFYIKDLKKIERLDPKTRQSLRGFLEEMKRAGRFVKPPPGAVPKDAPHSEASPVSALDSEIPSL